MGLKILHGTQPSDLVDFCMRKMSEEAKMWPQKRAFLIVPEQTKADMERRYLQAMRDSKSQDEPEGLMLVDVLSFNRFSHRILSEVGGVTDESMDASMSSLLIHRILSENKEDFKVLSRLSDRFGFAAEIEKILGDFYRYQISPHMLRDTSLSDISKPFSEKMSDFALLMEKMDVLAESLGLSHKVSPMQQLSIALDILTETLGAGEELKWPYNRIEYLKASSIYIVGFGQTRNFTPEEYQVIDRLNHICEQVSIALCVDHESDIPVSPEIKGSDAFYFGRSTLESLVAQNSNVKFFSVDQFRDKSAALSHLSYCYAKRHPDMYLSKTTDVTRVLLLSRVEELSYVAGMIQDLVLNEGYRYKDMTVAVCDYDAYSGDLHAVFSDYGLDPFLDKRRKLSETPLMRFVFALIDLSISEGSYLSLMKCVKSGMCHLSYDEADIFENYCLAHGLYKGYKIFDAQYYDVSRDNEGPEVWACVNRAFKPIMQFVKTFKKAKRCGQKAQLLLAFLEEYLSVSEDGHKDLSHIESLASEWVQTNDHNAALALVASYNALTHLLKGLVGPFGDMNITGINFRGMLYSGMEAATSGAIPSYLDQILITDPAQAFNKSCKILFLVGATRDRFPFRSKPEGYLRDFERELLEQGLGVSFPRHARDSVYSDFFTAYALLDCPDNKLIMTAISSEEPSGVFRFIGECLPGSQVIDAPKMKLSDPRTYSKRVLYSYIAGVQSNEISVESLKEVQRIEYAVTHYSDHFSFNSIRRENIQIRLPAEMVLNRYGDQINMSVSQIEKYASCPFQHFADYMISLREREEYKVDRRYQGSLAHKVVERAIKSYIKAMSQAQDDTDRDKIHEAYLSKNMRLWSRTILDEVCREDKNDLCADPSIYMSTGAKIIDISEKSIRAILDQVHPNQYLPKDTEWSYGFNNENMIQMMLEQENVTLSLCGKIDRVDVDENLDHFRVIDYKSSQRKMDYDELFAGLSLQLPVYVYAYAQHHPNLIPGDAGYFHLNAPMCKIDPDEYVDKSQKIDAEIAKKYKVIGMNIQEDELMLGARYALEKIKTHCRNLLAGHYDVRPVYKNPSSSACSYCKHAAFCGINPKRPPFVKIPPMLGIQEQNSKKKPAKEQYLDAIRQILKDGGDTK